MSDKSETGEKQSIKQSMKFLEKEQTRETLFG